MTCPHGHEQPYQCFHNQDVHGWFSLSYASYLTLPRALLQEMPCEWQERFVALLEEMGEVFETPTGWNYTVTLRDDKGRFLPDRLNNYRHPDRSAIDACRRQEAGQ